MKVSRAQSEENRQTVIATASRLFRERGFDGVSLSDLMKAAGLTHGGFYNKFESKEDLAAQACTAALDNSRIKWTRVALKAQADPFASLVRDYLSERHRDNVGEGCTFASLGTDAMRHGAKLCEVFESEIEAHLDILDNLQTQEPDEATRDTSIAALATMVGALLMSRVVTNPALSRRFLEASAQSIIAGSEEKRTQRKR